MARRRKEPEKPQPAQPKNRRVRVEEAPPVVPLRARWASVRAGLLRLRRPFEIVAKIVLVLLVAAGALGVGRLVERHVRTSPSFAVHEIALSGQVRLTREEVLSAAGLAIGRNVFDLSQEDAERRLMSHPWIAEAHVRRRLPGRYEITVRERRAVALLALEEVFLVAEDGAVFKRVAGDDPVDLPVITGIDRDRFTRDRAFRTSILLEGVALLHDYRGAGLWRREPISELHVERDDGLSLYVGDDATYVRLGHGPFRAKLRRLRMVLDQLAQRGARAAYVYLDNERRPDRVTVRVRDEEESVETAPEPAHQPG